MTCNPFAIHPSRGHMYTMRHARKLKIRCPKYHGGIHLPKKLKAFDQYNRNFILYNIAG